MFIKISIGSSSAKTLIKVYNGASLKRLILFLSSKDYTRVTPYALPQCRIDAIRKQFI